MPMPTSAHFRSFAPLLPGLLLALCCARMFAESPSAKPAWHAGAAVEPLLPRTICLGGADVDAHLDPWIVDTPADFSGHYVSDSVTDGWLELRVTIRPAGMHDGIQRWVADVFEWDDRQEPDKREREFQNLPVTEKPQPYIQLDEYGPTLFFLQRRVEGPKGATLLPSIVSPNGSCFRFEPGIPKSIVLGGSELPINVRPWKTSKPAAYEGHYVAITPLEGSAVEIDLTAKPHPGSQFPWRLDAVVTHHFSGKEDTESDYIERPLWEGVWPHFDATEAYAFVYFADPRTPGAKATPALITSHGNVLVKEAKP